MVPFGQPPKKEKKWELNGKRISSNSELLVSIDFILVPSSDYPYGLLSWGLGVLYDKRVVFLCMWLTLVSQFAEEEGFRLESQNRMVNVSHVSSIQTEMVVEPISP